MANIVKQLNEYNAERDYQASKIVMIAFPEV